ncbi:MAG: ribonuclease HI [Bdellovibrionaceae bacterium]|nr:ribonuclease HI [Pseudobdellovibrionaceae bacterium]|tara:strand:+ start:27287 stop:28045 length:759 start_codon:yes stop_codon:yes gene_type:complete
MSENAEAFKHWLIFTDGACSGNPGPGGYGTVIVDPSGHVKELGGKRSNTTNNQMELQAVIEGLKEIQGTPGDLWILTDSTYVIHGITKWIWGWKRKGWTTADGKPVNNQPEWKELDRLVANRKGLGALDWKYVRGHSGTPGNERCDGIAVDFTKGKWVDLYDGPLLNYGYAIHDLPEDMSVPEMKSRNEKKKSAYSYLSYAGGELKRHKTWKECEAQVKGRSGAKFKKATSATDEKSIVESWGLSPEKLEKA